MQQLFEENAGLGWDLDGKYILWRVCLRNQRSEALGNDVGLGKASGVQEALGRQR